MGRANARLFVLGENLDWMHGKCITASIAGMHTEVEIEASPIDDRVVFTKMPCDASDNMFEQPPLAPEQRAFGERLCFSTLTSWRRIKGSLPPKKITVRSNQFLEGGLASSSSLCVAVTRALWASESRRGSLNEVAAAAFHAENEVAGVPCGRLDHLSVQLGGCVNFSFEGEAVHREILGVPDDIFILLVSTGVPESFSEIGQEMRIQWEAQSPRIVAFFEDTLGLVEEFAELSQRSKLDARTLGSLLTSAQESINSFHEAVNRRVKLVLRTCSRYGSLGGKCSGMRRTGGVAFCVFDEPISKKLIKELSEIGFKNTHQFELTNAQKDL